MVEARSFDVDEAMRCTRDLVGEDPRIEKLAELREHRRSQAEPPPLRLRPDGPVEASG
jgi:hypothetical protein